MQGDYIFIVDGDDYIAVNFVESISNKNVELEKAQVDTISWGYTIVDENYKKIRKVLPYLNGSVSIFRKEQILSDFFDSLFVPKKDVIYFFA